MAGTGTTTNYDVTHIQQGPGDLWIVGGGVADSPTPQLTLDPVGSLWTPDSTAYPSSVHLGAADGATTIAVTPKMEEIKIDQCDAPVGFFLQSLEMSLEVELKQLDPALIQNCAPFGAYAHQASPGYSQLTFGGLAGGSPTGLCVAFISNKRGASGKVVVAILFNAVGQLGLSTTVGRAKQSIYKAQFKGFADLTRTAGRQVGVIYETL